jgi:lipopolysaccharide/colanic/teichoic acid biosynthesis glycosyltransferase
MRIRVKRALDISVAVAALLLLAPLMILLAAAVKRSSPGPVFFRQRRVGRGGKLFWLLKYRTMWDAPGGPALTAAGDPRITPLGRRLRRWKLDELPQLVNVLRGEMSLVGPRPEVPQYVAVYDDAQRQTLSVRPGITGPSQIRFRAEEKLLAECPDPEAYYLTTLLPRKLQLDLQYVREGNPFTDLRLLAATIVALWRPMPPTAACPRREDLPRQWLA